LCCENFKLESIPQGDGVKVDGVWLVAYDAGLESAQNVALIMSVGYHMGLKRKRHTFVFIDDESSLSRSAGNA
jgi:hypothetical protein